MTANDDTAPLRAEQISPAGVRAKVLEAVRAALAADLLPTLTDDNGSATVHLVLRLLDFLGEEAYVGAPSLAGRSGLPQALADELGVLVGERSDTMPGNDIEAIGAALARVSARTHRGSAGQPEAQFVQRLAQHELRSLAQLDHRSGGPAETYAKGRTLVEEHDRKPAKLVPTEAALEALLRAGGRYGADVKVTQLREIPGGFNKLTSSFVASTAKGDESLILRRDALPNPTGFTVVDEWPVLTAVFAAGVVPMAEPLLLERDPAVLGSPAVIVRRMPGSTDITQWRNNPEAGRALAQELARSLARLHAIDVSGFLPAGATLSSAADYTAADVDRWRQKSLRWRIRPTPAIDAGFAWAMANIPQSARKPVFVHGDVGFHNMLMDRGHLTALLDWEFSHIGDPMEDLNYCKPFVTAVCDWSVFLDAYHEAGGVDYDPAAAAFFELWPSLRNGSGCDALMRTFLENPGSDLKFAVAGTQHVRSYENAVLEFLGRRGA